MSLHENKHICRQIFVSLVIAKLKKIAQKKNHIFQMTRNDSREKEDKLKKRVKAGKGSKV